VDIDFVQVTGQISGVVLNGRRHPLREERTGLYVSHALDIQVVFSKGLIDVIVDGQFRHADCRPMLY
jgi:hypothetical protein